MRDERRSIPSRRLALLTCILGAVLIGGTARAESPDPDDDGRLGTTARVEWSSFDGERIQTITIHGEPDRDLSLALRLRASFGPLEVSLLEQTVDVRAGRSSELAVDLGPAAGLDPLQASYATRVFGQAAVTLASGRPGAVQQLEERFLVIDGGGAIREILDADGLERDHPGGVTSASLRARLAAEAASVRSALPGGEDWVSLGYEPGLAVTAPRAELDSLARLQRGTVWPPNDPAMPTDYLPPGSAWTRFCIELVPVFKDAGGGEDWWKGIAPKTARGIRLLVIDKATWESPYFDFTDRETGCTRWMALDTTRIYRVQAYSQARVSSGADNTVDVRSPWGTLYSKTLDADHVPSPGTRVMAWNNDPAKDVANIVAAAAYAVNKRDGGLSGETFILYNKECSYGGSCAQEAGGGTVYLSETGRRRKFIIGHELGHAVSIRANQGKRAKMSNLDGQLNCFQNDDKHAMTSMEYQGKAAHEGFGHLYAASVWNDPGEHDCAFAYYLDYDFDHDDWPDGEPEDWEKTPWVSCQSTWDDEPKNDAPSADFLHGVCWGNHEDRGTEYDWLRALWNLHNEGGVGYDTLVRIWDRADPHTWKGNGDGVYEALDDAAQLELTWDEYAVWINLLADHGLQQ